MSTQNQLAYDTFNNNKGLNTA